MADDVSGVVLEAVPPPPNQGDDPFLYRIVVGGLVTVAIIAALGTIALAALTRDVPEGLIAFGSAALGALGGMLVQQLKQA